MSINGKCTSAPNSCTLISVIDVEGGRTFPSPSLPSQKMVFVPIVVLPVSTRVVNPVIAISIL
jgi:hypothetical protein